MAWTHCLTWRDLCWSRYSGSCKEVACADQCPHFWQIPWICIILPFSLFFKDSWAAPCPDETRNHLPMDRDNKPLSSWRRNWQQLLCWPTQTLHPDDRCKWRRIVCCIVTRTRWSTATPYSICKPNPEQTGVKLGSDGDGSIGVSSTSTISFSQQCTQYQLDFNDYHTWSCGWIVGSSSQTNEESEEAPEMSVWQNGNRVQIQDWRQIVFRPFPAQRESQLCHTVVNRRWLSRAVD